MLDLLMTMSTFTNLKDERVPSPPYNTTLRSRESSNLEPISTSPSTISTIQILWYELTIANLLEIKLLKPIGLMIS